MSKNTRTILFLICLILFLLTSPLVILYSQGYRFDLSPPDGGIKITQTGGLFIRAEPRQADIYINNDLVKRTDFFFGSALIENLLPKRYKIEVKKENYLSWEKNLEIKEREVTEVKNIILFPEKLNFTALTSNQKNDVEVMDFWLSPDKRRMILLQEESSSSPSSPEEEKKSWALKLYDPERNIKSHLISETDVSQQGAGLINLEFSEDSRAIYLDIRFIEEEAVFVLQLDRLPSQLTERKITPLPENIITSKKYNQDVYHLDNSGYLLKNDSKISETPFMIEPEFRYNFEIFSDFIFLLSTSLSNNSSAPVGSYLASKKQNLYLFCSESKSFELFFEKINGLEISPDRKKMAFFSNSEVWVLFLEAQGIKNAGEKLFISRLSERINNVRWLNSDYLIFNSGGNLKIAELDDRDRIQIWNIAVSPEFESEIKINFNQNNKKLYVLNRGDLLVSPNIF